MNQYLCFNKGYNVTIDNYFTSLLLTEKFLTKNTKIVFTVRRDSCQIKNGGTSLKKENYIQVKYIQTNLDAAWQFIKERKIRIST